METLHSASGFNSEASLSGTPTTPPYTPARTRPKRRFERSDSPASNAGSVHPAETSSPAKKAAKRGIQDEIQVQELAEGDMGYITDVDVVFPDELEEVSSDSSSVDGSSTASDNVSDSETTDIARKLSRMRCGDDQEVDFEKLRRRRHVHKRTDSRVYKRSHSQSVSGDRGGVADPDAIDDQDLPSSQRRLRRRVYGPGPGPGPGETKPGHSKKTSTERGTMSSATDSDEEDEPTPSKKRNEAMDVDVSK